MTEAELNIPNAELLSKLHLMVDGKLKRSAVLLFYSDPEVIQNGSYVKIGKFGNGADLQYQHTLEGSLITTADKIIDLIYLMYLKAKITYEHDRRVETYPFARDAIQAIYNAIAHNCYMYGTPIQIRVEDKAIIISNRCILPKGWTVETLMKPHDSIPYNPDIARVFYRAGYIETWGRGIEKICDACKELGADLPKYELRGTGLRVHFTALQSALIEDSKVLTQHGDIKNSTKSGTNGTDNVTNVTEMETIILALIRDHPTITVNEIAESLSANRRTILRNLAVLKDRGIIERRGSSRKGYWEIKE